MAKVLIVANHELTIYNFRMELLRALVENGYEVVLSLPEGEHLAEMTALGCIHENIAIKRHGMNPIEEIKLYKTYRKLLKQEKPDVILGFTIKPNIYGAMAAKKEKIPFIANITGLGTAVESGGIKQKVFMMLYRMAFKKIEKVFFQNEENEQFFLNHGIANGKNHRLPGSGVNLERFSYKEYPSCETIRFTYNSRVMKEKGIDEYLNAAKQIKSEFPKTEFHICGFCEEEYNGRLEEFVKEGIVIYHGMISNVPEYLMDKHCVVNPTFYPEGMSNVLLESAASGRAIISTDRAGSREAIEDGVNGYLIKERDTESLVCALRKFLTLSYEEQKQMGQKGREKMEREFDRNIIVNTYLETIEKAIGRK